MRFLWRGGGGGIGYSSSWIECIIYSYRYMPSLGEQSAAGLWGWRVGEASLHTTHQSFPLRRREGDLEQSWLSQSLCCWLSILYFVFWQGDYCWRAGVPMESPVPDIWETQRGGLSTNLFIHNICSKHALQGFSSGAEDVRLTVEILVPSAQVPTLSWFSLSCISLFNKTWEWSGCLKVGRIIGKGGGNVREMQRLTGAVIKLPEQVSNLIFLLHQVLIKMSGNVM